MLNKKTDPDDSDTVNENEKINPVASMKQINSESSSNSGYISKSEISNSDIRMPMAMVEAPAK